MAPVDGGVIGSTRVTTAKPKAQVTDQSTNSDAEKVAIYSSRNVSWDGVGTISRGYNIMTQAKANKWLTRDHTRLATPEEVAKEYEV